MEAKAKAKYDDGGKGYGGKGKRRRCLQSESYRMLQSHRHQYKCRRQPYKAFIELVSKIVDDDQRERRSTELDELPS